MASVCPLCQIDTALRHLGWTGPGSFTFAGTLEDGPSFPSPSWPSAL